jgi:hypothetical protein
MREVTELASPAAAATAARWTFAQKAVLAICIFQIGWATAGLIAEPSFHVGLDAPTERVLWVDFNGWHAVSGFLLFGPGLIAATRPDWTLLYCWAAGAALVATGIWAVFENQVAYFFTFPNNEADAVLHLATGLSFLGIGLYQRGRDLD